MASAASATRGLKRICTSCGTRYYDLDKRPILCPSCSVEFTGDTKLKARRTRAVVEEAAPPPVEEEKDIEVIGRDADVVGLDDVEEGEDDAEDTEVEGDLEELDDLEDDDEDLEEEIGVEVDEDAER